MDYPTCLHLNEAEGVTERFNLCNKHFVTYKTIFYISLRIFMTEKNYRNKKRLSEKIFHPTRIAINSKTGLWIIQFLCT